MTSLVGFAPQPNLLNPKSTVSFCRITFQARNNAGNNNCLSRQDCRGKMPLLLSQTLLIPVYSNLMVDLGQRYPVDKTLAA
jgi:hypothetical protein